METWFASVFFWFARPVTTEVVFKLFENVYGKIPILYIDHCTDKMKFSFLKPAKSSGPISDSGTKSYQKLFQAKKW